MDNAVLTLALTGLHWVARIALIVSVADLLTGFVHWLEDNYGEEDWPIVGRSVIAPNLLHHTQPRAFLENNWWRSADYQVYASIFVLGAAFLGGWLCRDLVMVFVIAANGNEVHKWAHRTKVENGRFITWLQDHRVIQSRRHHANHHRRLHKSHYCTITLWVNPLLDNTGFWRFLEFLIAAFSGVLPRREDFMVEEKMGST